MKPSNYKIFVIGRQQYVFNKLLIRIAFIISLLFWLFLGITNGGFGRQFYYSCQAEAPGGLCQNPFWVNCSMNAFYNCIDLKFLPDKYSYLSQNEFFNAGFSVGSNPALIFRNFLIFILSVFFLTFLVNHFKHNKGFNFRAGLEAIKDKFNEEEH